MVVVTRRRRTVHELRIPSPDDRDRQTQYSINCGLGIRPEEWWLYDSDRPDLAEGAGLDAYSHLEAPYVSPQRARTIERFAYLVTHDLITASERDAIAAGIGPRYEWRQQMLQTAPDRRTR